MWDTESRFWTHVVVVILVRDLRRILVFRGKNGNAANVDSFSSTTTATTTTPDSVDAVVSSAVDAIRYAPTTIDAGIRVRRPVDPR